MNFPDTPLFAFLFWLIDTPGIGGVAVFLLGLSMAGSVSLVLRWISGAAKIEEEKDVYAYPTPALHHEEQV